MEYTNDREIDRGVTDSGEQYYEVPFGRGESPAVVVAETVARIEGHVATDSPPVHEIVDGDALQQLFEHAWDRPRDQTVSVHFRYGPYRVHLESPGTIRLVRTDD